MDESSFSRQPFPNLRFSPESLQNLRLVGVLASRADLTVALTGGLESVDLCELRLDLLGPLACSMIEEKEIVSKPLILTARDPAEGGAGELSADRRRQLLEEWLPFGQYLDIEWRNLDRFSGVCEHAKQLGRSLIISSHYLDKPPSQRELEQRIKNCSEDAIFKVACRIDQWQELRALADFLESQAGRPVAMLGMGPLGKLSRLVFALLGSELIYVSLGQPVVTGQWDAASFRSVLSSLMSG